LSEKEKQFLHTHDEASTGTGYGFVNTGIDMNLRCVTSLEWNESDFRKDVYTRCNKIINFIKDKS